MKIDEVRRHVTTPLTAPAFAPVVPRFTNREYLNIVYRTDADALAMELLARSQGVATLAHAFDDERFIAREVERMGDWLTALIEEDLPPPPAAAILPDMATPPEVTARFAAPAGTPCPRPATARGS